MREENLEGAATHPVHQQAGTAPGGHRLFSNAGCFVVLAGVMAVLSMLRFQLRERAGGALTGAATFAPISLGLLLLLLLSLVAVLLVSAAHRRPRRNRPCVLFEASPLSQGGARLRAPAR